MSNLGKDDMHWYTVESRNASAICYSMEWKRRGASNIELTEKCTLVFLL
jgi:hypothetical protein